MSQSRGYRWTCTWPAALGRSVGTDTLRASLGRRWLGTETSSFVSLSAERRLFWASGPEERAGGGMSETADVKCSGDRTCYTTY